MGAYAGAEQGIRVMWGAGCGIYLPASSLPYLGIPAFYPTTRIPVGGWPGQSLFLTNKSIHMRYLSLLLLILLHNALSAQEAGPFTVEARAGETLSYEMDLQRGTPLTSLDWAWSSQNACFVEPRAEFFTGNNVFFRTEIPKYSTMVIRLIPKDKSANLSLYAYSGGHGALPPDLPSCVSCEADFKQERRTVGKPPQDHTRSVELRAVTRPYPVTIGVVGANGLTEGAFYLEISVKKNR